MQVSRDQLKQLLFTIWNVRYTSDLGTARLLAKKFVKLPRFQFNSKNQSLTSSALKTSFEIERHEQFLAELENLELLATQAGAEIEALPNGELSVAIKGLKFIIQNPEEIFILREAFITGSYNLHLPQNAVVLDIGMNIGIVSLFLAENPKVDRIYSFEPFPLTYEHALRNLALNAHAAKKIVPHHFALSNRDAEIEVEFSNKWRGNNSIFGVRDQFKSENKVEKTEIKLRDSSVVVRQILAENEGKPVFCKVDCEGSEYDILENLAKAQLLPRFAGFMIEWHDRGPKLLEQLLTDANFSVISLDPVNEHVGMIYAFRQN